MHNTLDHYNMRKYVLTLKSEWYMWNINRVKRVSSGVVDLLYNI